MSRRIKCATIAPSASISFIVSSKIAEHKLQDPLWISSAVAIGRHFYIVLIRVDQDDKRYRYNKLASKLLNTAVFGSMVLVSLDSNLLPMNTSASRIKRLLRDS